MVGNICIFLFFLPVILLSIIFIGQKEVLEIEKKTHKPSIYNLNY